MTRNPVVLSLQNFKEKKSIAVEFTSLTVTVFKKLSVEYTSWNIISPLSDFLFRVIRND